jgi:MFS family permease
MASEETRTNPGSPPAGEITHRESRSTFSSSFYTVKRYQDFRYLWVGNFFTVGAQWIQILTIGWLVLKLTDGNALLTGTVVGIRSLPVLLIGPWAGVLADRVDRRKIVMITQACMATAATGFALLVISTDLDTIPVSGPLKWWHPFIYMAFAGVGHSIIQPVRQAMVANTVPRRDLSSALALNGMAHPTMRIIGPSVGGLLIATLGFKWNFLLEAAAYLAIVALMFPVKLRYREDGSRHRSSVIKSMAEGLRFVWQDRRIRQLIVMSLIPNFVFQPLAFLLPVFITEVLHRGAGTGGLLAAAIGGGGIVAAVIVSSIGYVFRKGMVTFIGLVGGCIFILGFAQSHWFVASMLLLGGLGFCQYIFRVGNSTLLQTIVPDALRGRVMSIYFLDNGFTPLATLAISLFVHLWSPSGAFSLIAGVSLILAILQLISFRPVRRLE